jgi:hypothetical protein
VKAVAGRGDGAGETCGSCSNDGDVGWNSAGAKVHFESGVLKDQTLLAEKEFGGDRELTILDRILTAAALVIFERCRLPLKKD